MHPYIYIILSTNIYNNKGIKDLGVDKSVDKSVDGKKGDYGFVYKRIVSAQAYTTPPPRRLQRTRALASVIPTYRGNNWHTGGRVVGNPSPASKVDSVSNRSSATGCVSNRGVG